MNYNVSILKEKIKEVDTFFFDLDGTLIDTERLYFRFWKEASKFYGRELNDEEALNMRSLESNTGRKMFESLSLDYDLVKSKRIEMMNEYFKTHDIELKEGAVPLLKKLHDLNKRIYIVTANALEKANNIIEQIGIGDYLDGVISAKDVTRGKPYPDVFIYASKKVDRKPSQVLVFEDSPNGLKASHGAGCFTVMIEDMTEYEKSMDYVDASISSFLEIL